MTPAALPLVNWIFWATLSSGTLGVVAVTELLGGTTRGYRLFMAFVVTAFSALLLLSELAVGDAPGAPLRRWLVMTFVVGALAYLAAAVARLPRAWLGVAVAGAGIVAAVALAIGTDVDTPGLFAAQVAAATVVLGSVTAAMLLGHWYLVTPRLSPRPLQRMMWLLVAGLVAQAALFGVAFLLTRGDLVAGPLGWLTWLRLGAGTLLPGVATVLAIIASRAPSLQASTGLLYIGLALSAAGCIAGSSITYLTGVPV